jgi:2-polyprenyl-3-methyl-5-hydroxy-6-metoxy-1,4-benzoquinol methylase
MNYVWSRALSREAEEYFEQVSGRWDILRKSFYGDEVRDAVLNAARIQPSDTVLDVGAGTGFLTEAAAKIARKVIALDFSEAMTAESRGKLSGQNVEFKIGNVERIPLANESVNAVIGNMILHHSLNPDIAIRDMHGYWSLVADLHCLIFSSTIMSFCERNTLTDGSVSISHPLEVCWTRPVLLTSGSTRWSLAVQQQ